MHISTLLIPQLLLDREKGTVKFHEQMIAELRKCIKDHKENNEMLQAKMMDHETERRILHNTIQELKV